MRRACKRSARMRARVVLPTRNGPSITINRGGGEPLCGVRARFVEEDSDGAIFPREACFPRLRAIIAGVPGTYCESCARVSTKVPGPGRGLRACKVPAKNVTNGPVTPDLKYSRVVLVAAHQPSFSSAT